MAGAALLPFLLAQTADKLTVEVFSQEEAGASLEAAVVSKLIDPANQVRCQFAGSPHTHRDHCSARLIEQPPCRHCLQQMLARPRMLSSPVFGSVGPKKTKLALHFVSPRPWPCWQPTGSLALGSLLACRWVATPSCLGRPRVASSQKSE